MSIEKNKFSQTFTITFGDQAENHAGMQKIGSMANEGFSLSDLNKAKKWFESRKVKTTLFDLRNALSEEEKENADEAYVLLISQGLDILLGPDSNKNDFFKEQKTLDKDSKCFMYGRVVNKHARHNLCFADDSQEPDYASGKGRVVAFQDVPLLNQVRQRIGEIFGDKGKNLLAEGNYYYDVKKCGIGFHGDAERRLVIGVRVGAALPLEYQWFHRSIPIGQRVKLVPEHGDMYIMSEKATGNDWKHSSKLTLRHAAGCDKFLHIPPKNRKQSDKKKSRSDSDEDDVREVKKRKIEKK